MEKRRFWPRPFREISSALSPLWEEDVWGFPQGYSSGLTLYEEGSDIVIEASLPGIGREEIDISYDQHILTIEAEKREEKEDKERKYFRKASSAFFYRMNLPPNIDHTKEPHCIFEKGLVRIIFAKNGGQERKKIRIEEGG
jgi:HSP20 family protein